MDAFNELSGAIALSLGAGGAIGLNLYTAVLTLGLLGATGHIVLQMLFEKGAMTRKEYDQQRRLLMQK